MTDSERRNLCELRRLLAVVALPGVDRMCAYADPDTRTELAAIRQAETALWQKVNARLLATDEEE